MPTERSKKAKRTVRRPRSIERKPTISIIGAGRLGTALALALSLRGYSIEAIVARRTIHARRAARLLATGALSLSATQLDSLPPSDLLLITTPDDAIAATAARLAASLAQKDKKGRGPKVALHCSGALSADVLAPLRDVGLSVGSIHPLVSISDPSQGAERLRRAYYCVEGEGAAVRAGRRLVRDLEGHSFSINSSDKALYHASAVMASGHMVALFDIALEMLARCGLTGKKARPVLLPLVQSTLENLYVRDPAHALTGTFARADVATMRRHLAALGALRWNDTLEVYRLLGHRSLQLAEQVGVDPATLKKMRRILNKA
jgi:predicted short-subunit dehydrogenase-like oxidoreductase (DUF2520 family)